jgi:hypothetical protein
VAFSARRVRIVAVGAALAALLLAPSVWAVDTLSYATSGTFPSGGPASVQSAGGGGFGGFGGRGAGHLRAGGAGGGAGGVQLFGAGAAPVGGPPSAAGGGGGPQGAPPGLPAGAGGSGFGKAGLGGAPGGGFGAGNDASLSKVLSYVKQHGGGTVAVSSQSSAAEAIIDGNADVAGIGGFSGRESDVSVAWLAQEVSAGHIRWVVAEQGGSQGGPRLAGDTRTGSKTAMAAVAKACTAVKLSTSTSTGGRTSSEGSLYDCQGRAAALLSASAQQSAS